MSKFEKELCRCRTEVVSDDDCGIITGHIERKRHKCGYCMFLYGKPLEYQVKNARNSGVEIANLFWFFEKQVKEQKGRAAEEKKKAEEMEKAVQKFKDDNQAAAQEYALQVRLQEEIKRKEEELERLRSAVSIPSGKK